MTPQKILSAKTTKKAAKRMAAYLESAYGAKGVSISRLPKYPNVRGKTWALSWDDGPVHWAVSLAAGCEINEKASKVFKKNGPFPNGIYNKYWCAECYNGSDLTFWKE